MNDLLPAAVAGGAFPSPVPFAHVTTTATHKSMSSPPGLWPWAQRCSPAFAPMRAP